MWTVFIVFLALASSQECSDPNCLNCDTYSGEEYCSLCTDGLFPSFSQCSICDSQPLQCDISLSKWSCFCLSTLTLATFDPSSSLVAHCIEGQPCQICLEGFVYENGDCLEIEHENRVLPTLPYKCLTASTANPNLCSVCEDGFYPESGYCTQCFSNCKTCSKQYECITCNAPLVFESNKKACCVAGCNNCHYGTCLGCGTGYTYSNYDCTQSSTTPPTSCPANCNACSSSGVCSLCNWGYGIISTPNVCQKCDNGYYPITGGCGQCFNKCTTCDWLEVCTGCVAGYTLISGYCCAPGCSSCNLSKCWGCNSGYLYDGTNCNACPSGCNGCPKGVCATSTSCPLNCDLCPSTSPSTSCLTCKTGYYPITGGCDKCFSRCTTCDWYEVCTACALGYTLINGYCCTPGSTSCNLSKSWGCATGYLYDGTNCNTCPSGCNGCPNGGCQSTTTCPVNCDTCTSTTSCSKCKSGYYPVTGGCDKCFSRCTTCDWYEVCTDCAVGYSLKNGYCCPPGCSSCNLSKCWGCNTGYLYDGTNCNSCPSNCNGCPNGVCVTSTGCPANCDLCTSSTSCSTCKSGYYPVTGGCDKCFSRCTTCDWYEVCTDCAVGYTKINGYCCPPGCSSCNHIKCWGCNSPYTYDGTNCVLNCPANCDTCSTSGQCTACKLGYYGSSGSCLKCFSACSACSSYEVCTSCVSGFTQIGNYCCPQGCSACSQTACTGCNSGYSLIGNTCTKCPDNCSSCTATTVCSVCNDGYFNSNGLCTACNPKCKTCSALNKCFTCFSGYQITGPTSALHPLGTKCCLTNCLDCTMGNDNCSSCRPTYTLNTVTKRCE